LAIQASLKAKGSTIGSGIANGLVLGGGGKGWGKGITKPDGVSISRALYRGIKGGKRAREADEEMRR
jgi:hypothetical protein